jgi:nucleotide-binding universal stress UspA family protein
MNRSVVLIIVVAFSVGLLSGFLTTAVLPDLALVNLYQEWGAWGIIGRVAIAVLLIGLPISYIAWLVGSAMEAMRPRRPMPVVPLFRGVTGLDNLKRVLVPVSGGRNALLGMHVAANLARAEQARLTIMRVVPPSMTSEVDVLEQEQRLRQRAEEHLGLEHHVRVLVSTNASVVQAIVDEVRAGDYDLLVIGASERPRMRSLFFGTIPHALAEQVSCPMLIVRAAPPVEQSP